MSAILTIDKAGRIVIPKAVREALRLDAGDALELEAEADSITLRPVRRTPTLVREQGVWVYRSGGSPVEASLPDLIRQVREDGDAELTL